MTLRHIARGSKIAILTLLCAYAISMVPMRSASAACTAPSTDYGRATSTVSIPSDSTYRIWSRVMPADLTNKGFLLEVDGNQCYTVSSNATAGTWDWVDYQNGTTSSKITLALTKGNHTIQLIGNQPGVAVDRVIFVSDQACVPTGFGDNCNVPSDITPPTVSLTAPTEGATVSGAVAITAQASDDTGVSKVEFYANSQLLATSTTSPYQTNWDTTKAANGSQVIIAKAYDAAGNMSTDSYSVTVQNGDTQSPSVPAGVSAKATSTSNVTLSWQASSDNVGVAGYHIYRGGALLAQIADVTTYQDTTVIANTQYTYTVTALDAAGNESAQSSAATVTTPNVADTQPPSTPQLLSATAVSSSQINLAWRPSTDNTGIAGYDIYRSTGNGAATKIKTVTTTSYGDTNLKANTQYTYYVVASDPAGNKSQHSNTATVTTLSVKRRSRIIGTVSGSVIPNARIEITISGVKYTTTSNARGHYVMRGVPSGRYNVTYSASGHYSTTIPVTVTDTTVTQNVQLQKK